MSVRSRLVTTNHRGAEVPAVLGFALIAGGVASVAVSVAAGWITAAGAVASGAALMVALAGAIDDLLPGGPRGLRGHLRALGNGQVSTGVVKLVVITAAALITVAAGPRSDALLRLSGVVLIAGAANLWNGLDVRPGRALKSFLLIAATGVVWVPHGAPFAIGVALVALVVLVPDLQERAMLGDAGANLLGFAVGVALFVRSSASWVPLEALLVVGLNIVAETMTLSRVIAAVPPLRWIDGLGAIPLELDEKTP
jgi:UDP-GlcNAc:undecaprenyl-phosphate/decaprenyl-phosphate GlcNAc-1-phosphate transferase